jgi:zinc transport system permease protein
VVLLRKKHSHDSILGILSYSSLALSLIVTSFMPKMRVDITSYLFGDILLIDQEDIIYLLLLGVTILLVLKYRWRQLVIATVSEDIAQTEGINVTRINLEFMVLISILVAISFKIIGILLITAMLIIPAAAARNFSNSPVQMIIMSVTISIMSVVTALSLSLEFDLPSGATIITIAFVFFIISNIHKLLKPS